MPGIWFFLVDAAARENPKKSEAVTRCAALVVGRRVKGEDAVTRERCGDKYITGIHSQDIRHDGPRTSHVYQSEYYRRAH